ncbi:hypothetical protein DVH24_041027 [Malus domestica]|uniref:Geraniol 8-hydroxylase n=1 Tax=Malus domestica TaxID=3750 RepID=A0A498I9N9_MALDO|nr:hypothetical protein DVH24_041027 [Malus domestica]
MTLQLGQITTVVISSSFVAKEVLRTHDQLFCNQTIPDAVQACKHSKYSMAWTPVSATWRNLRKTSNRHLKVQELISDGNESAVKGEVVDIGRAAFKTSLNLLSRTVFSVDLADPHSERAREFKELVWSIFEEAGKPNLADYFPVLKKIDPQGIRRHTLINISEEKNEDMDMDETQHLNTYNSTQHLFLDLFVAAADTTSSTLEWAMAELLSNLEKLSKAQAELKKIIVKGKPIEESDIAQLPYLYYAEREKERKIED